MPHFGPLGCDPSSADKDLRPGKGLPRVSLYDRFCHAAHESELRVRNSRPRYGRRRRLTARQARDDGRYANEPLHAWFDQLASGKGLCCSFVDGFKVENVDWDTEDGSYRVRLHGEWITVLENALITQPNKYGPAVVWPYMDANPSRSAL